MTPPDGLEAEVRGDSQARGWWLALARGLVALCLGGALLVAGAGQSRLATFIGIYWLLGSVLTIRWVMQSRGVPGRRMGALAAGIGAVTALALLARSPIDHVVGTGALLDLVGGGAIATGMMRMLGGFRDDEDADEHPRKRSDRARRSARCRARNCADPHVGLDIDVGSLPCSGVGARRRNVAADRRAPTATVRAHERRGKLGIVTTGVAAIRRRTSGLLRGNPALKVPRRSGQRWD